MSSTMQARGALTAPRRGSERVKQVIKRTPLLGPLAASIYRRLCGGAAPPAPAAGHERLDLETAADPAERARRQVLNLLAYTKASGSAYRAQQYPAGYHWLDLDGVRLAGQRDPRARLAAVPLDLAGKTVLDIGCNAGGMLFEIADRIRHGVGIDYDARTINAANRLRAHRRAANLDFYVFNLETEDLQVIRDFLPGPRVDVAFLLSVCMWIRNWHELIDFTQSISSWLVFESNGSPGQQDEQAAYLRQRYAEVRLLSDRSDDDPGQKQRRLYLCR